MKRNGFTIIETSLVLAIAGLILVLVFVALPALQRSQRDAQRKSDIATLAKAIKDYQSNTSRGTLPSNTDNQGIKNIVSKYIGSFVDPNGSNYDLQVAKCEGNVGTKCSFDLNNVKDYKMYFVSPAKCSESNEPTVSDNPRKAVILYRLEVGNEVYCYDL